MNKANGILVVDRLAFLRRIQSRTALSGRSSLSSMSPEDIFRRYRGFDGIAWPHWQGDDCEIEDGLALPSALPAVERYLSNLPNREEAEAILLVGVAVDASPDASWAFRGFDLGYFESESSHFSVVLNEILFGRIPEMKRFAKILNEGLLLPSLEEARSVLEERARTEKSGADVERGGGPVEAIGIYGRA